MYSRRTDKVYIALTVLVIIIHAICVYNWICIRWDKTVPNQAEEKPYKVWQSGL